MCLGHTMTQNGQKTPFWHVFQHPKPSAELQKTRIFLNHFIFFQNKKIKWNKTTTKKRWFSNPLKMGNPVRDRAGEGKGGGVIPSPSGGQTSDVRRFRQKWQTSDVRRSCFSRTQTSDVTKFRQNDPKNPKFPQIFRNFSQKCAVFGQNFGLWCEYRAFYECLYFRAYVLSQKQLIFRHFGGTFWPSRAGEGKGG